MKERRSKSLITRDIDRIDAGYAQSEAHTAPD